MYPCESTKNHLIKYHLYFSKRTLNITEIKGNITYLIPYDDTLTVSINICWILILIIYYLLGSYYSACNLTTYCNLTCKNECFPYISYVA